jgi:hypothetical protein
MTCDVNRQAQELELLFGLVESLALRRAGGHLSLFRFGSGWKVGLGTPDLLSGSGYGEVWHQPTYPTIIDALRALVLGQPRIDDPDESIGCTGFPCALHLTPQNGTALADTP